MKKLSKTTKTLFFSAIILIATFGIVYAVNTSTRLTGKQQQKETYVYICDSPTAYAYHSGNCSGLSRCTHQVLQITLEKAQQMGRVPCKICFK